MKSKNAEEVGMSNGAQAPERKGLHPLADRLRRERGRPSRIGSLHACDHLGVGLWPGNTQEDEKMIAGGLRALEWLGDVQNLSGSLSF